MRSAVKRAAAAVATAAALATSRGAAAAAPAAAAAAPAEFEKPWFYHKVSECVWMVGRRGSVGASGFSPSGVSSRPPSPHTPQLDGPTFRVTNTSADGAYEVRQVDATAWATVTIEDASLMGALNQGFRKLFKYISGANTRSQKIEMTVPVLTAVQASAGPFCKSKFTVGFMVPPDVQASPDGPPEPTDADVVLKRTGAASFYVAFKGGWVMTDGSEASMASALVERLQLDGVPPFPDAVFLAGYDPPFRLLNRHNEVWIPTSEDGLEAFWGKEDGGKASE